jgi:hypothetical protein
LRVSTALQFFEDTEEDGYEWQWQSK